MIPVKSIKIPAIANILRFPLLIMIALLPGLFVSGQVKFTTVVNSQEIGMGDYFQVEFVVENAKQIDQLTPPDFPGFHIAQGPIQSSGMSIVNGNMSQYKALSFVLQPVRTGKYTIAGASAVVDGRHMQSNSITITVSAAGAGGNRGPNNGGNNPNAGNPFLQPSWPGMEPEEPADVKQDYVLRPGENIKEKIRKNIFLKVQVDKTTCYAGEPIVATYKLYSHLNSESRVTKRPSLNGFSVYDMVDPNSDASSFERLNGKTFTVHIIRKTQLIPFQAGTINLDPVEVENTIRFVKAGKQETRRSGNSLRDLFDQLSDNNNMGPEIEENVTLDTKPVAITIKALPEENKPAGYNGAVGSFTIRASLAATSVAAQDQATLHVTVTGKGNLPVINAPAVTWPSGVEAAFDPTAKDDINKTTVPMSGSKTFEYAFTTRTPGRYTIPAVSFSWFDPSTHSYKTAGTEPLDLQVTPAVKRAASEQAGSLAGSVPAEANSIGVQKFMERHLEWIFTILILSLLAFYLMRQNIRFRRAEGQQKAAALKKEEEEHIAARLALATASYGPPSVTVADPLREARQSFDEGDYKGFYREVNRAVWKAVTRKLDIPASELNKSNIARQLQARGWDVPTTMSLENILNECEMNLYTPAYDTYNMQQLLGQAESMLGRLG